MTPHSDEKVGEVGNGWGPGVTGRRGHVIIGVKEVPHGARAAEAVSADAQPVINLMLFQAFRVPITAMPRDLAKASAAGGGVLRRTGTDSQ